jgi:hypothetical protein
MEGECEDATVCPKRNMNNQTKPKMGLRELLKVQLWLNGMVHWQLAVKFSTFLFLFTRNLG